MEFKKLSQERVTIKLTSPPIFLAAVIVLRVPGVIAPLLTSATTNELASLRLDVKVQLMEDFATTLKIEDEIMIANLDAEYKLL